MNNEDLRITDFYGKPITIIEVWNTAMVFEHDGKIYTECDTCIYEGRRDDL